jgi:hypothetical protein
MANTLIELWMISAIALIATHLTVAFIVDRSISLGIWAKGALIVFSLLGPLGVLLEAVLLFSVLKGIANEKFSRRALNKQKRMFHQTRWQRRHTKKPKFAGLHG